MRKLLYPILLAMCLAMGAYGQDDDPIRVDSSIVRLNVGVTDRQGRSIRNLTQADFSVLEDGVKQQITNFQPSTAPFSLVVVLDMSGSTLPFRPVMKQAAYRFVSALKSDDRVAVVEFYDKINLRNDFTSDARTIAHSIEASNGRGKTQFYKALEFALNKLAGEKGRRKAVIVLSDGVDTAAQDADRQAMVSLPDDQIKGSIKPENNELMNRVLQKSDALGATIYPLALPTGNPAKLADPTPRQVEMFRAARARLDIVANRTGAQLREIQRLEDMGRLYGEVAADLRALYTIEYTPLNDKRDGKWRAIKVEVNDVNLNSRTRTGYFAK